MITYADKKFALLSLVFGLFLSTGLCTVYAAPAVPANALKYLPALVEVQKDVWPLHPWPSTLAAQVEQESCISLTHSKCWNPRAELKTSREYGFGFPQLTIARNANGTERFNVFNEVKALDPVLKTWAWEDRYNPSMQLRALLVKNKLSCSRITGARNDVDYLAFCYAAYNGGVSGVLSDRRMCAATKGCDPRIWFGNVEHTSNKRKTPVHGYGKSFFAINREYVVNVLRVRRPKYDIYFPDAKRIHVQW